MQDKVYEFLKAIPRGKVVTYGMIASYLGNKKLARVVGNILHHNPDADKIPCYKVVNAQGKLSNNYAFGGIDAQRKKLEEDGIKVVDNHVDLAIYLMKER